MGQMPPFPVDDITLGMLMTAIEPRAHGDPDAEQSNVGGFLEFMSQMAGSDTSAISEVVNDGSGGGAVVHVLRDPQYHEHDVIAALVAEIRRLRGYA